MRLSVNLTGFVKFSDTFWVLNSGLIIKLHLNQLLDLAIGRDIDSVLDKYEVSVLLHFIHSPDFLIPCFRGREKHPFP